MLCNWEFVSALFSKGVTFKIRSTHETKLNEKKNRKYTLSTAYRECKFIKSLNVQISVKAVSVV